MLGRPLGGCLQEELYTKSHCHLELFCSMLFHDWVVCLIAIFPAAFINLTFDTYR